MPDENWRQLMWGCERWLSSYRPRTAAEELRAAADALEAGERPDHYGSGPVVEEFETMFAELLGVEAAVLFPTGTMAQQIALRLHCERRGTRTVAFHPTCHLELHEHAGYAHLHGLKAELIGHRDRLIELDDLKGLRVRVGAVLLELPQREIGGQLPEWDDLVAQVEYIRERGAALHLDGARIWETAPYYGRPHAEIASLFDTVYVSLYKGLLGLAGSILAGPREIVDEARVWRRRHGGELLCMYPLVASARPGLARVVERMPVFLQYARELARQLGELPGVRVVPDPPQTPLFHVHLTGDRELVWQRALDVAREQQVWLFGPPEPTVVPGVNRVELNIEEAALEIPSSEAAGLFAAVTVA